MKWITRAHPKIDRVACPWLITRFIDGSPEFHFAAPDEVMPLAERLGATPFDLDGARLSHRGDRCSFDAFLEDYHLEDPALHELADIVRGADTDRLDLSPQAPGLLAISLGLSRLCVDDDHRMLAHGFVVYDALYEWLRHARHERHGWNPGRTSGEPAWDSLRDGALEVRLGERRALVDGTDAELRPKEFALLVALVARSGRVLGRPFLLQHVWAYEPDVTTRTVDWHVAQLRSRLGACGRQLVTVRGAGYRWDSAVTPRPPVVGAARGAR